MNDAPGRIGASSLPVDIALLQQLDRAVRHTFSELLHVDAQIDAPLVAPNPAQSKDLTATVELKGEVEGQLLLRAPIDLATRLTELLPGAAHQASADQVCDMLREVATMLAGRLGAESDRWIRPGTSVIAIGETPDSPHPGHASAIAPIVSEVGDLYIELTLAPAKVDSATPTPLQEAA